MKLHQRMQMFCATRGISLARFYVETGIHSQHNRALVLNIHTLEVALKVERCIAPYHDPAAIAQIEALADEAAFCDAVVSRLKISKMSDAEFCRTYGVHIYALRNIKKGKAPLALKFRKDILDRINLKKNDEPGIETDFTRMMVTGSTMLRDAINARYAVKRTLPSVQHQKIRFADTLLAAC